jgi:hypothetical protein
MTTPQTIWKPKLELRWLVHTDGTKDLQMLWQEYEQRISSKKGLEETTTARTEWRTIPVVSEVGK